MRADWSAICLCELVFLILSFQCTEGASSEQSVCCRNQVVNVGSQLATTNLGIVRRAFEDETAE